MKALHTAVATATDQGRDGHVTTDDDKLDLEMSSVARREERLEELVARAHDRCPYSNATRGNIAVDIEVASGA